MDKHRAAAIAARGEQIKTSSLGCRGIQTADAAGKAGRSRVSIPDHLQLQQPHPLNRAVPATRSRP